MGEPETFFDVREGDFKLIYPRQQVLCRLYLDDALLEVQPIKSSDKNTDEVMDYISSILKKNVYFKKVKKFTEKQFRTIEAHLVPSHEKHEGNEASSALTKSKVGGSTKNDKQLHPLINPRPFSILSGTTKTSVPLNKPIMIWLNKCGYLIIKTQKVHPSERAKAIKWIWSQL